MGTGLRRRRLAALALALTLGPLTAVSAACSDDDDATPSATVGTQPTSTTEARTVEEEVEAAYLRSWDVYAEAMRTLDTSELPTVYVDEALELRRAEIQRLREANTPARMRVEHDYVISVASDERVAIVVDEYRNHSVLIDPVSGEPTEPDPNNVLRREYRMRLVGGTWMVADVLES